MAWCNAVCNKGYAPAISAASQSIETVKFRKGTKVPKCIFSFKHRVRDSHFKMKTNKSRICCLLCNCFFFKLSPVSSACRNSSLSMV